MVGLITAAPQAARRVESLAKDSSAVPWGMAGAWTFKGESPGEAGLVNG